MGGLCLQLVCSLLGAATRRHAQQTAAIPPAAMTGVLTRGTVLALLGKGEQMMDEQVQKSREQLRAVD